MNTLTTRADELEAEARCLMAQRHEARGFDSQRVRDAWLAEVDAALDAYNEASE